MTQLDVVDVTKHLVAIDSVSKHTNAAIADVLEPLLREGGFTVERLEHRDANGVAKVNLVGRKGSGEGGLGFFSHVDTVPGTGWDRDRWTPIVEGDRLIGLGSCDMKGPLAATLVAAAAAEETSLHGAKDVLRLIERLCFTRDRGMPGTAAAGGRWWSG